MRKHLLFLFFMLYSIAVFPQDMDWWEVKHDWDGVSSWMKYITYSPSYMGPNALPVPDVSKAYFEDNYQISTGSVYHYSEGDQTYNFITDLHLPVAPGRAGVRINYMPVEFYNTDTITRDIRAARDYETNGYSAGDFYLFTYLQVIRNHRILPDVMLTINLKTASGTNLRNARNTDAPGYWFDVSAGKTFPVDWKKLKYLRPYGMAGFYCYQTNCYKYTQNDAFLFGLGSEIGFNKLRIDTELGGYIGYFGLGDKPIVYRLEFSSVRGKILDYKFLVQEGLKDFPYTSFSFNLVFNFKMPKI